MRQASEAGSSLKCVILLEAWLVFEYRVFIQNEMAAPALLLLFSDLFKG